MLPTNKQKNIRTLQIGNKLRKNRRFEIFTLFVQFLQKYLLILQVFTNVSNSSQVTGTSWHVFYSKQVLCTQIGNLFYYYLGNLGILFLSFRHGHQDKYNGLDLRFGRKGTPALPIRSENPCNFTLECEKFGTIRHFYFFSLTTFSECFKRF